MPAATDETYTRSMPEPLETTPCRRPSASSTKGTLASLRGRAGGTTRAVLALSQFSRAGTNSYAPVKVYAQTLNPPAPAKINTKARPAGDATPCTASVASYLAHGDTFATSGQQVFVDFDTVTVKPGQTDSLDIAVPDKGCFAQIDLYRGAVKYDGKQGANDGFEHGDLPAGPDHAVINDKLIASWNGGAKDCTSTESQPPTTPPASTPPSAPASESATPTPSASTPESPDTPVASASTTVPAATPSGGLAETGGGSDAGLIAGGAAVLLAGGAAILVVNRRRRSAHS